MSNHNSKSERDLVCEDSREYRAGLPLKPHTGEEPPATEGRVKAAQRRSGAQGSLDADRAGGSARSRASEGEGSVTPLHKTSGRRSKRGQGSDIVEVSPVSVDGNTRLEVRVPSPRDASEHGELSDDALELVERLCDPARTPENSGVAMEMPWDFGSVLEGPVVADWTVSGGRSPELVLHVEGVVYVRWNVISGRVNVQAKALYLWAAGAGTVGWESWCRNVLVELHRFFFNRSVAAEQLHSKGWNVTGVEVCKDLVGLEGVLNLRHGSRFLGKQKPDYHQVDEQGRVETIEKGKRSSGSSSFQVYDKTKQVEDKGFEDFYKDVWRRCGYTGGRVTRVEIRFRDKALNYKNGPNFRDPATLFDPVEVDKVWCSMTRKYRLTKPTHSRKTECKTDERWIPVMKGTHETFEQRLTEDRTPKAGAHRWRMERNNKQLAEALGRLCALTGQEPPRTFAEVGPRWESMASLMPGNPLNDTVRTAANYGRGQRMWFTSEIESAAAKIARPTRRGLRVVRPEKTL